MNHFESEAVSTPENRKTVLWVLLGNYFYNTDEQRPKGWPKAPWLEEGRVNPNNFLCPAARRLSEGNYCWLSTSYPGERFFQTPWNFHYKRGGNTVSWQKQGTTQSEWVKSSLSIAILTTSVQHMYTSS